MGHIGISSGLHGTGKNLCILLPQMQLTLLHTCNQEANLGQGALEDKIMTIIT